MTTGITKIKAARKDGVTRARIASILGCRISTVDRAVRSGKLSEQLEAVVQKKLTLTAIKRSEGVKDRG
jgi:hypothetical protein